MIMKKLLLLLLLFFAGCASGQPVQPELTQSQDAAQQITASPKELNVKPVVPQLSSQAPDYVNRVQYLGKDNVIGMVRQYTVKENDSLIEIARRFDLGYNEITDANPGIDPFVPDSNISVLIPTEWILPDVRLHEGIILNISEMRLYFFPDKHSRFTYTFPIGIGDDGKETPVGNFKIINKTAQPYWIVPKSIRKENPKLPKVVPPGPDNPLGSYALRLSTPSILIHGTNKPWGIGRKVSHGCIHLYPEDISWLFNHVKKGMRVTIIKQPVKIGVRANRVYLEVHPDGKINYLRQAIILLSRKNLLNRINSAKLNRAIKEKRGIPVIISN